MAATGQATGAGGLPRLDVRGPLAGLARALIPIGAGLLVGAVVLAATGWDPVSVYRLMLREAFGSAEQIEATLGAATPLLFTGLATAIAFRAGIFNVGVEGSFLLGGLAGAWLGAALDVPGLLLIPVCLAFGAAIGALWSLPPAVLRARLGVDEVVTTLMLNYVAALLAGYLVNTLLLARGTANSASEGIFPQAELPALGNSGTLTVALLIALAALALYALWARGSASGFEQRMTGRERALRPGRRHPGAAGAAVGDAALGPRRRARRQPPTRSGWSTATPRASRRATGSPASPSRCSPATARSGSCSRRSCSARSPPPGRPCSCSRTSRSTSSTSSRARS